ncbi:MAG: DNA polymerase III subunit chi [Caulobacteraceae bacterium]
MACEVWFYHLEQTALDQALPDLLEKTLARGWRALVRSPSAARLEHLDAWLWTYRDDAFLAHGTAAEEEGQRQPILLTGEAENVNAAQAVFLLDDAEPGALDAFERCIVMFDGRDDEAVAKARGRWKAIKAAGHPASYWRQSDAGRWEKQA